MVDVELSALSKRYGGQYAVDYVDLSLPSGTFVTLLGPSGCGKTTTLRSIAGLEEPDGGSIRIGQRTMVDVDRRVFVQPEKRNVGMVFQSYALWPHLTVAQNVAYPLKRQRKSRGEIEREVDRILDLVNLRTQRDRSVAALSGGQQQRVALARAMVGDPVLTLFDEPLSNLDVKLRGLMRTEIRALHDRIGMTSIYVTHDQEEALALSDLVVVMNAGQVQQAGRPEDIFFRPANAFVADFVGYENRIPATVVSGVDGAVRVRVSGNHEFTTTSAAGVGNEVSVYGRPASLTLTAKRNSVEVARGKVLSNTYLGTVHEYRVQVDHGVLTAQEPAADGVAPEFTTGTNVSVYLDAARAVVLPSDESAKPSPSLVASEPR